MFKKNTSLDVMKCFTVSLKTSMNLSQVVTIFIQDKQLLRLYG